MLETDLQKLIVGWCHRSLHKDILFWSTPNERKPKHNMGGLRAMGMLGGVSDLIFVSAMPDLDIIFVELKQPPKNKNSKRDLLKLLNDNQKAFKARVDLLSLPYYVIDNLDDFIAVCKKHKLTKVR